MADMSSVLVAAQTERLRMQLSEVEAFDDKSIVRYWFKDFFPGILLVLVLVGI